MEKINNLIKIIKNSNHKGRGQCFKARILHNKNKDLKLF